MRRRDVNRRVSFVEEENLASVRGPGNWVHDDIDLEELFRASACEVERVDVRRTVVVGRKRDVPAVGGPNGEGFIKSLTG